MDWLHNSSLIPRKMQKSLQEAIKKINQDGESINNLDSFEMIMLIISHFIKQEKEDIKLLKILN